MLADIYSDKDLQITIETDVGKLKVLQKDFRDDIHALLVHFRGWKAVEVQKLLNI